MERAREDGLNREVHGTAEYVLKAWFFKNAESLCAQLGVHTFRDLGGVSPEAIEGTTLPWVQKEKLKHLCVLCRDEDEYRKYQRKRQRVREEILAEIRADDEARVAAAEARADAVRAREKVQRWREGTHAGLTALLARLRVGSRVDTDVRRGTGWFPGKCGLIMGRKLSITSIQKLSIRFSSVRSVFPGVIPWWEFRAPEQNR
jgi:hypothetical protein